MQLHNNDGNVTVIIDVSFSDDVNTIKDFVLNEQCPFIQSKAEEGLIKFEWFIDEETKTGTLIEIFNDSISWEKLADKVIGTPVNIKFNSLFIIEKMTVLGELTDNLEEKLQAAGPMVKNYVGGIN
tara:strand:+ start:217 stop:594 length:378 start_codon:yes stop_codon:yes gene_type:complete